MVGQQLSGMNAVMFYAVDIFNDAGSGLKSIYASIIIAIVQVRNILKNKYYKCSCGLLNSLTHVFKTLLTLPNVLK